MHNRHRLDRHRQTVRQTYSRLTKTHGQTDTDKTPKILTIIIRPTSTRRPGAICTLTTQRVAAWREGVCRARIDQSHCTDDVAVGVDYGYIVDLVGENYHAGRVFEA